MGIRETIDLTGAQLQLVDDLLSTYVPRMEVWAFGSRVKWTSNPASDLDLVVLASSDPTQRVARLRAAFDESNLPFRVDLHIWGDLPESFHDNIAKDYLVLRSPTTNSFDSSHVTMRLADFAPFSYGRSLPSASRNPDGRIPVYGSNGIIGYHDIALTSGPTIIVGRKGTVGAVHYSSTPCWPIDTTFYIEGSDLELVRFKYYLLKSLGLDTMNYDSAVPGLNRDDAHAQEVSVPPPTTQRSVSRILGSLDDKIDLNHQMSRTLEEIAQTLFRARFVNFGLAIAETESELGLIPHGWRIYRLDELATFVNGLPLQKFPPTDLDSLPIIKIAQLRSGDLQGADLACAHIDPKFIVENGDILFSWSGSLECRIWTSGRGALNQHLYKVIPNGWPKWLCYFAIHEHLNDFREIAAGKATTMGHIQRHHLRDAKLALPPSEVVEHLTSIVSPILEQSVAAAIEARRLQSLRDTLLPMLLSGRLRVSEPESLQQLSAAS